jgi:hypothetical protein
MWKRMWNKPNATGSGRTTERKDSRKETLQRVAIAAPVLLLLLWTYLFFGIQHLGQFQTADEDLWFSNPTEGRVHEYWRAIQAHDWAETRINDKPGATTALLSGWLGNKVDAPDTGAKMIENNKIVDQYDPVYYEKVAFAFRLPLVVTNAVVILFIVWFVIAFSGSLSVGLMTAVFLYLSPILLGISQIVNPDATLWSFGAAALFGYLAYLRHLRYRYLIPATICLGAALASKYTGAFLLFFGFFVTFAYPFFFQERFTGHRAVGRYFWETIFGFLFFLGGGILVFAIIMPAAFVEPEYIYKGTIGFRKAEDVTPILQLIGGAAAFALFDAIALRGRIMHFLMRVFRFLRYPVVFATALFVAGMMGFLIVNWKLGNAFDLVNLPFDTGTGKAFRNLDEWVRYLAQWKSLVFTVPPVALFLALFGMVAVPLLRIFRRTKRLVTRRDLFLVFAGAAFILFFYQAASMQRLLVHVRYSILLYPVMAVLGAIGATILFRVLGLLQNIRLRSVLVGFLATLIVLGSLVSLEAGRPFYFNYTSDLLPKRFITAGAWGYGGYEAAQVLNALPNAEKLLVWADYEGFCPFFKGKCIKGSVVKWWQGGDFEGIDYFVTSRRGMLRNKTVWKMITQSYDAVERPPYWSLHIGDRPGNFVRIYKATEDIQRYWIRDWLDGKRRKKGWVPFEDDAFPLTNEQKAALPEHLWYQ